MIIEGLLMLSFASRSSILADRSMVLGSFMHVYWLDSRLEVQEEESKGNA